MRRQLWKSIRILRRFTTPDLIRTIPDGVSKGMVQAYLRDLEIHGVIKKFGQKPGGRPGNYQQYRLVSDYGPAQPDVCQRCQQQIHRFKFCISTEEEKETEIKTNKAVGGER